MQRAFLAVAMAGLLCSTLSFFVVLNRLSFMGAGISHAILGGIAIGVLLDINPLYTAGIFAVFIALAIGTLTRNGRMHPDTVIGVFFASGMALGVFLISLQEGYHPELFSLLFGNVLAVTAQDLWFLGGLKVLVLVFVIIFFKELLAISFDEELARANGLPVSVLYMGMLVSLALTVVVSVLVLGVVLAAALLVIPAATGHRLCTNYRSMLFLSLGVGLGSGFLGLGVSYRLDVPSGAAIVLCAALFFFLSQSGRSILGALGSPKGGREAPPGGERNGHEH